MVPRFWTVPCQGAGQGAGQRKWYAQTGGGVPKGEGGVYHTTFHFSAGFVRVFRPRPDDPNRASGEGETGATPPFSPLARFGEGGVSHPVYHRVYHTPPPSWGSLPSLCIPAGRLRRQPQAGARRADERRDD